MIMKYVQRFAVSKKKLPSCQCESASGPLLVAGSGLDDLLQTVYYYKSPVYVTEYPPPSKIVSETARLFFFETVFDINKPVTISTRAC